MSVKLEDLVSLSKRRGFIYQGSEIYGGLAGTWDYGPLGVRLKHNLQNIWWQRMVDDREDIYPLDAAILMNKKVWEASGHIHGFHDPLIECKNCHSRFREDEIDTRKCPVCGKENSFGKARQFNMMLKTNIGPVEEESTVSYLRPETAQGIFVNFKNVVDSFQPDMPFGIAQVGKAFRNEISPRDFLFRCREFEQMEMQYFIYPNMQKIQYERWRQFAWKILIDDLGIAQKNLRWHEHGKDERAHYAAAAHDIEFNFPFGFKEVWGTHDRTDYDLQNHQKVSGKSMVYAPKDDGEPFIPYVIESSVGLDRMYLAVLSNAYTEDQVGNEKRVFLKLKPEIAPIKVAVFPLLKNKPELVKKAREVYDKLKPEVGNVIWDDNGNIGKRYRRQDEIGTPYTVTIDFDTLEDNTVTVRNRDTTTQERVKIDELSF